VVTGDAGKIIEAAGDKRIGLKLLAAALVACGFCLLAGAPAQAAPAWLPPTDLSAAGKNATGSALVVGESGETVAVWARQDPSISYTVQASTRSPGAAFSAPADLSTTSFDPDVAMTPGGEAVAVWRKFDVATGKYVIQAATRPPGGGFSLPVAVSISETSAQPQELQVAVNPSGEVAVAWRQTDPSSPIDVNQFSIVASVRPPGGSFSTPVIVSAPPLSVETEASSPRVAIDAAGDVTTVWSYDNGTDRVIESATRPAGGSFSAPVQLSASGQDAGSPAIAAAADVADVAWIRSNGANSLIEASTGLAGGSFSAPVALSTPGEDAFNPAIAMSPAGEARVAWIRSDGVNDLVEACSGSAAGAFSAPAKLSEAGESAFEPAVAVDPGGGAAVVWKRSNGANDLIEASIDPGGGGFSSPVRLSAAGQDAISPVVAMDGSGDATALWLRSNGANEIAQAAGYDADAPLLRNVSIPASGTVGVPVSFSASPFDVWSIASTGFSFGDGAGAAGTSVSHAYSAPGTYPVTVTSKDAAGTASTASGSIAIRPSNDFVIKKLLRNKKKGTGTLVITIPGPGLLVLRAKGVKRVSKRAERAGNVKIPVKPTGKLRKRLARRGRAKVGLAIAFTPDGGEALVKRKKAALIEKLP
jgi:hypothetical protein